MLAVCCQRREQFRSTPPFFPVTYRKTFPRMSPPVRFAASFPCNRNGRAIRAAPFADRLPASTSVVLANRVPERRPAIASSGKGRSGRCREKSVTDGPAFRSTRRGPADARLSTTLNSHPHLPGCRSPAAGQPLRRLSRAQKRFGYLNRAAETLQILRACGCTSLLTWSKPLSIF